MAAKGKDKAKKRSVPGTGKRGPKRPAALSGGDEIRLYGRHAIESVWHHRPAAIRKVYLTEERVKTLAPFLQWCAAEKLGYRIVPPDDLSRIAKSPHHEGVCIIVLPKRPETLSALLTRGSGEARGVVLGLDGVTNPHNVGALLRSAAHFGALGLLGTEQLPEYSGALARVAAGAAEVVPIYRVASLTSALQELRAAGFAIAVTSGREGTVVSSLQLPEKLVIVMGSEGEGISASVRRVASLALTIPGTGAVESLNVSAAAAVLLSEWARLHGLQR